MTDDLVERLLDWPYQGETMAHEAADRIEQLTAERDAAYARGYSDAETEISKSALGQKVDFLHSQYANAVEQIKDLNELLDEAQTEWSKYASSWMTAEGKLADAEALIEAQAKDHASNNIRFAESEHRAKVAEAESDRLREALDGLLTLVEHANFEEGWCCCGDDMLHHQSPMDCGHTPVDMGEYHASLAIKEARAALKGETP